MSNRNIINRKVYYVTSPGYNDYRWYTRNTDDFYIMAHKSALSKSPLYSHIFYDKMHFNEITVKETVAWVNYILDKNEYISQNEFEENVYNSTRYRQSIGRGIREPTKEKIVEDIYKRGDIVITKNKISNVPWMLELGNSMTESDGEKRWNLVQGFSADSKGSVIGKFGSVYAKPEDIIRIASGEEQEFFQYCVREGKVQSSAQVNLETILTGNLKVETADLYGSYKSDTFMTSTEQVGLISFGSSRKKKTKTSKKVQLKINKIENYEY